MLIIPHAKETALQMSVDKSRSKSADEITKAQTVSVKDIPANNTGRSFIKHSPKMHPLLS